MAPTVGDGHRHLLAVGFDPSVWDATAHKWSEVKGTFKVAVGASSRDLKLKGTMDNL